MLSLRRLAAQFIRAKVDNGRQISFWYDHWSPLGPLIHRFGALCPRKLSIPPSSTVSEACSSTGWSLLGARSPAAEELQTFLTTIPLPSFNHHDDRHAWVVEGSELNRFSISKTWNAVRNRALNQAWTRNIWFKGHVPRQAFTAWVAHLDRLPTRTRLMHWGMNISPSCCLCNRADETKTHLFLHCEISDDIWKLVLHRLGYSHRAFHTWLAFAEWTATKDTVTSRTLKRLVS